MSLVQCFPKTPEPGGQIVRFSFVGKLPSSRMVVAVGQAFRASALSALHVLTGSKKSFLLSGHRPDGAPDDRHEHAYYLSQVDTRGRVTGMLVVSPRARFDSEELEALKMVRAIQWDGPSTRLSVELVDDDDEGARVVSGRWVTRTLYVPIRRFWGTHGKHHLTPDRQLVRELEACGCRPVNGRVDVRPGEKVWVRSVAPSTMGARVVLYKRRGYYCEFAVDRPICGPVALGHSCHFGLGQFQPTVR